MIKLDLKDKKLLFALDFASRKSYTQLGKEIGLSKQGVEYKLRNLIKKGVISSFFPVINAPLLGYLYCRLLLTLQQVNEQRKQEIIAYFSKHKKVFWLFEMQGPYDLLIVLWATSVSDFNSFIHETEKKYGLYIKKKIETIATDVTHYQHRYLLDTQKTTEIHTKEVQKYMVLDTLDKKLLDVLCFDTRASLISIAKQLRVSAKIIAYRLQRLEREKIIQAYRPVLNHQQLGYTYYKVFLSLCPSAAQEQRRLQAYLQQHPLVIYRVEGIGLPADLDIEIMVQSNEQLFAFIEGLKFTFPTLIEDYQTVVFLRTLKVRYLPF